MLKFSSGVRRSNVVFHRLIGQLKFSLLYTHNPVNLQLLQQAIGVAGTVSLMTIWILKF